MVKLVRMRHSAQETCAASVADQSTAPRAASATRTALFHEEAKMMDLNERATRRLFAPSITPDGASTISTTPPAKVADIDAEEEGSERAYSRKREAVRRRILALLLAWLAPASLVGQSLDPDLLSIINNGIGGIAPEAFKLYTECAALPVHVTVASNLPGLSEESVEEYAERRLRIAGILGDWFPLDDVGALEETSAYLEIAVTARSFEDAVSIWNVEVSLERYFLVHGAESNAPTWVVSSTGVLSGDDLTKESLSIQMEGSQLLDLFIDEYLRVNAEACEPRGGSRGLKR